MKKFIPLLLAVFAIALIFCRRDPGMDKPDSKYLVCASYDTKVDFKAFETYYLPDSILITGNNKDAEYWKDESVQETLSAYVTNMNNRGYARVDKRETADLGLQISYVKSTYYFTDYRRLEWWWNYPGYRDTSYWGSWGGWYYPYIVNYVYSIDSFIIESLNLNVPQGEEEELPILRTSYTSRLLSGSTSFNTKMAVEGANQVFIQSAYLSRMNVQPR